LPEGTLVNVIPVEDKIECPTETAAAPVSPEQKEALLSLIGIWKTERPPSDEELERIIEQERMKKYG
jgi:hypothetical protein